jgi:uncharacterized protein
MTMIYASVEDMPSIIPVFPLNGALLLPGGQMPLNIFEPRYLAMVDDAIRTHRLIGMVQPEGGQEARGLPSLYPVGCAGKITSFAETGDGRYLITLTGLVRYVMQEELAAVTPYRQCKVDYQPYAADFYDDESADDVDRAGLLRTLRNFAEAHNLEVDWKGIDDAPNDALVNALSMMSPFGIKEKQALLEAADLKTRADVLIAIAEMELARGDGRMPPLQ